MLSEKFMPSTDAADGKDVKEMPVAITTASATAALTVTTDLSDRWILETEIYGNGYGRIHMGDSIP